MSSARARSSPASVRVLVVEDSPEQALLIASFLEAAGFEAEVAADGPAALAAMRKRVPDLVATDLILPGLNGLELVEAVRQAHPGVPVILMTAFGSDDIAVQALKRGAASYVPKRRVRDDLVQTIENTLAVAQARRDKERLLDCLVEAESLFALQNDESLISPVIAYVQDLVASRLENRDENQLMQIGIALQEALLNAIHHGNLEVGSELRDSETPTYHDLVEARRHLDPYGSRHVTLKVRLTRTELSCVVRDEGPGFDPALVPDPTDPANLQSVSGRGLYLIWTFMDRVSHNDVGNEITMVKCLP
jgi:DNA-binding response OmpR family regulator